MDIGSTDANLRKAFRQMAPAIDATSFYEDLGGRLPASPPRRRSGLRLGVYASVAVVLVAALTVGTIEAVKHLGNDQPILVIGDEPLVITEASEASGLYPVSVDGKWGYIDKTGTLVIKPQFDWVSEFSEGSAVAAIGDKGVSKCGYIDKTGAWAIQPQFDYAYPFAEGLATVVTLSPGRSGESAPYRLCGFIDKTGDFVIPAQYPWALSFSEGLCAVAIEKDGEQKYGYIDKAGTMVIGPRSGDGHPADFSEGLAAQVRDQQVRDNGSVFIDPKGNEVLHLPGGMVTWHLRPTRGGPGFSEGLAVVAEFLGDPGGYLVGYIDKTGAVVIKLQFVDASDFSEGLAAATITDNVSKWGYIDEAGAWVIQPQFDKALPFTEGLAAVGTLIPGTSGASVNNFLYSFIDKTGTVVISLQHGQVPYALGFSGGIARVDTYTDGGDTVPDSMTYIDTSGKVIWQGQ